MTQSVFGKLPDGREVHQYTLKNRSGLTAGIINYGATVTSLIVPDRNGKMEDVVLGYDSLEGYVEGTAYFGAIVGRYGNRIGKGQFQLDGKAIPADGQRRREPPPRRENRFQQSPMGCKDSERFRRTVARAAICQPGRGRRISRDGDAESHLYADGQKRTAHRLRRNDGPAHDTESDAAFLFQSLRLVRQHDSRSPVDDRGGRLSLRWTRDSFRPGRLMNVANTPMDFRTPMAIGAHINDAE